jgi:hypothetical protein
MRVQVRGTGDGDGDGGRADKGDGDARLPKAGSLGVRHFATGMAPLAVEAARSPASEGHGGSLAA